MQVFYSLFRWSTKKDEAFLTVNYLKKIREQQMNETRKQRERQKDIEGIVKNMKRSYSIKKKEKKLIQQNNWDNFRVWSYWYVMKGNFLFSKYFFRVSL